MKLFSKGKLVTVVGVVALLGIVILLSLAPLGDIRESMREWIEDTGRWGMLWYFLGGTLLATVFCPISPIIFSAGLLFGFWIGLGLSLAVLASGAIAGFLLGEKVWDRIQHFSLARNRWFKAIHQAVKEEGIMIVALLRMTPFIQFTLANFFFGTLSLRLFPFILASLIGMLPGAILMVYTGSLARSLFGGADDLGLWQWILFGVGIAVFLVVSVRVTAKTRTALKSARSEA